MADLNTNTNLEPEHEAPEEIVQSESSTQLTPSATSTRNWIMYLPPEIRRMVYRQVLRLPDPIPYYSPIVLRHPEVQAVTGILRTCRLIRSEGTDVFFRENFFCVRPWVPSIDVFPSRRINDMIQNIELEIPLSKAAIQGPREQFMRLMSIFGNPGIERGTLRIRFLLHIRRRRHESPHPSMTFYLVAMGRFTNFRSVEIDLYKFQRPNLSTVKRCDHAETALQDMLGPATSRANGHGLTFFPQRFRNAQRMRGTDDWIDNLNGVVRLSWNEDETDADEIADEHKPKWLSSYQHTSELGQLRVKHRRAGISGVEFGFHKARKGSKPPVRISFSSSTQCSRNPSPNSTHQTRDIERAQAKTTIILPAYILPAYILPANILPANILPAYILPAHILAKTEETRAGTSTRKGGVETEPPFRIAFTFLFANPLPLIQQSRE